MEQDTNPTTDYPDGATENVTPRLLTWDDATWILTSAFIIFTMQSGFGLLEAGVVSAKNEVNIMVKNAVDVIFGGITYWMYGYGLSFGSEGHNNPFCGTGNFFVDVDPTNPEMGILYATYIFQLSFATTATTIVSGAMAERTKLSAYIVFSFLNTVVYCIPAHWMWGTFGWLKTLNCIDIAGSGVVHLLGGICALIAAVLLGPRQGRFDHGTDPPPMGNAANSLVGMFMLWWGWLGFNCGSTFGISGGKWKLAAKSAVTTINASLGGGAVGLTYSYIFRKRMYNVSDLVNSVLGGLVAVTASCAVVHPWEAMIIGTMGALMVILAAGALDRLHVDDPVSAIAVHGVGGLWVSRMLIFSSASCAVVSTWESIIIGAIGGLLSVLSVQWVDYLHIDDPVGAIGVHGVAGTWGMLAVGFFADVDPIEDTTNGAKGLFHGGGGKLLLIQCIGILAIVSWSAVTSFILLYGIDRAIGLRLSAEEEELGTDAVEHGINPNNDLYVYQHRLVEKEGRSAETLTLRRPSVMGMHRTFSLTLPCTNSSSPEGTPVRHNDKINSQPNGQLSGGVRNPIFVVDDFVRPKSVNDSYKCQ